MPKSLQIGSGETSYFSLRDIIAYLSVFAAYFATAKLGLYIFYDLHAAPAVIWPPVGIAVAAVLIGGRRMLVPIFLAQLLAIGTRSGFTPLVVISAIAYTIQPLVASFALRNIELKLMFASIRNTLVFSMVAIFIAAIGPLVTTLTSLITQSLTVSALESFERAWAGGVFSMLIMTPFILTWWRGESRQTSVWGNWKILIGLSAVLIISGLLFATTYLVPLGISVIFILPAALVWVALEVEPRWLSFSLFLTSVIGVFGTVVSNPSKLPINQQLVSVEFYIGFFAAFFLIFAAVVEERRRAYNDLTLALSESEENARRMSIEEKARSEFIAILAHELRNPLAPVMSTLEWLSLTPTTDQAKDAIESAQEQARMMQRLLDDLLDTVRITQKKFELQKETASLRNLVRHSVASTEEFLQSRKHALRVVVPQDAQIYVDPVRVKQILINLLNNAIKYTEPGGVLELSTTVENNFLVMRIKDNGIGIAPDMFAHIFEPFRRIQQKAPVGTGLGIGLSLTKRLVEMHNGRIEVESAGLGKGSTFSVYLPMAPQALITENKPERKLLKTGAFRILIVDDNEAAARGLERLLVHHGHDVGVAFSGNDALKRVRIFSPDVVLLDIGLPDVDGYQVARQLRASGWRGPLVALTGYGLDSDRLEAKRAGFNNHLTKPVGIADVIAILAQTQRTVSAQ